MYCDPYALLSREEHLKKIYDEQLPPDLQAKARAMAEERGIAVMELLREIGEDHDARMADPVRREELLRICQEEDERRASPFGLDPSIRRHRD